MNKAEPPRIDWRGADLRGANLSGMDLEGGDFRASDLRGVNFSGSMLRNADFPNTYISALVVNLTSQEVTPTWAGIGPAPTSP